MAHLSLVSGVSPVRIEPTVRRQGDEAVRADRSSHRGEDVAEISAGAREAARAESAPFRSELVRQVRQQIAAGQYETPEKLSVAADRVSRDLDLLA
jgi:anti-sigma28 factor (negative regulator of flagellin synthesis)